MSRIAAFFRWLGYPFHMSGRCAIALVNLSRTQMRAIFSLGMLGGIIALSLQNIGLIVMVRRTLGEASPGSLFGQMAMDQQWWNNAIMAGFGGILGLVVFGADYFRAKVDEKEIEFGSGSPKENG